MTTTTAPQIVVGLPLSRKLAIWYRELAEANSALGFPDLALDCERKAAALEYGGTLDLEGPSHE